MGVRQVRIGTRGSKLATAQAGWVADRLREAGTPASIRVIATTGDRAGAVPLAALGRREGVKGVFTKEIEDALLAREIDMAVHSLKDLPAELPRGLAIGCVPRRADPRDALLGRALAELGAGARVGTGSSRRSSQLRALAPGVSVRDIRGNVDTRIRKLRAGDYDAIVLAAAGLERLGLLREVAQFLAPDRMVPAAGQGALGIEIREGDRRALDAAAPLHDRRAAAEVEAERSLLRAVGGGCDVPLGAHATVRDGVLELLAAAARPGGGIARGRAEGAPDDAARLGASVAALLRRDGARFE